MPLRKCTLCFLVEGLEDRDGRGMGCEPTVGKVLGLPFSEAQHHVFHTETNVI